MAVAAGIGLLSMAAVAMSAGVATSATSKPNAKAKVLDLSDMPSGWSVDNSSGGTNSTPACLSGLKAKPRGGTRATVFFDQDGGIPTFGEDLAEGPGEAARLKKLNAALSRCKTLTLSSDGQSYSGSIGALSFPKVGEASSAFNVTLTIKDVSVGIDFVLFRSGVYDGLIEYADLGSPNVDQVQSLADLAVAKIQGNATAESAGKGIYSMGAIANVPTTFDGINKAAVYGFYPNISTSQPDVDTPPAGFSYGAVDAGECAGSGGAGSGADSSDFSVLLSNGSTAKSDFVVGVPTVPPLSSESQLGGSDSGMAAGQCQRGWIIYDIPTGVTPTYVEFTGTTEGLAGNTVDRWTIPA